MIWRGAVMISVGALLEVVAMIRVTTVDSW